MVGRNREIIGEIITGARQAAFFTQLDWVKKQCLEKLGFEPYPGTLNLKLAADQRPIADWIRKSAELELVPPNDEYCSAFVLPGLMGGINVAVVIPHERVLIHGQEIMEIIAPVQLKESLTLRDGDNAAICFCS